MATHERLSCERTLREIIASKHCDKAAVDKAFRQRLEWPFLTDEKYEALSKQCSPKRLGADLVKKRIADMTRDYVVAERGVACRIYNDSIDHTIALKDCQWCLN